MSSNKDGWEVAHRFGDVIVLGGFVIDLVIHILQIRGIVALDPNREALIAGGWAAVLAAVFFLVIGFLKFYRSAVARRYHHPGWDLLVGAILGILAVFCFITSPTIAPHHHAVTPNARTVVSVNLWVPIIHPYWSLHMLILVGVPPRFNSFMG